MASVKTGVRRAGTRARHEMGKCAGSAQVSESFTLIFVTTGWSQKVVAMASVKTGVRRAGTRARHEMGKCAGSAQVSESFTLIFVTT